MDDEKARSRDWLLVDPDSGKRLRVGGLQAAAWAQPGRAAREL